MNEQNQNNSSLLSRKVFVAVPNLALTNQLTERSDFPLEVKEASELVIKDVRVSLSDFHQGGNDAEF